MSLYYDKYLKYKNKYVDLKNQIGGALKESAYSSKESAYSSKESALVNNVTTFLEELIRLVHTSLQPITIPDDITSSIIPTSYLPPSDLLLQSIFKVSSNEQLNNLNEYLNYIHLCIQKIIRNNMDTSVINYIT